MKKVFNRLLGFKSKMHFDRFGGGKAWWLDSRGQGCLNMEMALKHHRGVRK